MALHILDLPIELLVRIALFADLRSWSALACANRRFFAIAQTPTLRRHHTLLATGMRDTSHGAVPADALVAQVQAADGAWGAFQPAFTVARPIPHDTAGLYELSGGYLFFGTAGHRQSIYYMPLPTPEMKNPEWSLLNLGEYVVDFALSLYEHNLIVAVTSRPDWDDPESTALEIRLLDFPSGRPHPLARQERIFLLKTPRAKPLPFLGIEVVGDTMAVATHYSRFRSFGNGQHPPSTISFWDWKEGTQFVRAEGAPFSYTTFIFLTEDLLLVPNATLGTFEYWRISTTDPKRPAPAAILHLPPLKAHVRILDMACRAEPNPRADAPRAFFGASGSHDQKADAHAQEKGKARAAGPAEPPFYPAAEDAICVFQVHLTRALPGEEESDEDEDEEGRVGNRLVLVVHRSAFVRIFEELMARDAAFAKGSDAQGRSNAQGPGAEGASQHDVDDGGAAEPPSLSWAEWGPPVSRWLNHEECNLNWITTSCGQRMAATLSPFYQSVYRDGLVDLYDFNPHAVERARRNLRKEGMASAERKASEGKKDEADKPENVVEEATGMEEGDLEDGIEQVQFDDDLEPSFERNSETIVCETSTMHTLFEGPLESRLPYVLTRSSRHLYLSGVMLDHRRVIGTTESGVNGTILTVQCFY
ncbi:hypothetical protein HDZ31DRAFT_84704 [Schizophyllum fasciatum]